MEKSYFYDAIRPDILCLHKKTEGYHTFSYHRHNGYEIYLFLSGNILSYIEQDCYQLTPGDIIIIPPTSMHRIVSLDESTYERVTINIKHSVLETFSTPKTNLFSCFQVAGRQRAALSHLTEEESSLFTDYAEQLADALHSEEYGADITARILTQQILLFMNKHYQTASSSHENIMPPMIRKIMTYIQNNLTGELSLTVLSEKFFHNGSYISRLFKKHTGLSLREYILNQRIEYAKQLLANGYSVSETCHSSGFSDYSNFIRSFTKVVQISPGRYKNSVAGNQRFGNPEEPEDFALYRKDKF